MSGNDLGTMQWKRMRNTLYNMIVYSTVDKLIVGPTQSYMGDEISTYDISNILKTLQKEHQKIMNGLTRAFYASESFFEHFTDCIDPSLYWDNVVVKHVDPCMRDLRVSVQRLKTKIKEIVRRAFDKSMQSISEPPGYVSSHTCDLIKRYIGSLEARAYNSEWDRAMDIHLNNTESFIWCQFADWKIEHDWTHHYASPSRPDTERKYTGSI